MRKVHIKILADAMMLHTSMGRTIRFPEGRTFCQVFGVVFSSLNGGGFFLFTFARVIFFSEN